MPTSFTPDDTPAWIKGDLPADEPDPQESAAPAAAADNAQSGDMTDVLPEPDENRGPDMADLNQPAAERPELEEPAAPDPEELENWASETDDLLPDPQEGASADPYDLSDPSAEPADIDASLALIETDTLIEIVITSEPANGESPDNTDEVGSAPEPGAVVVLDAFEPPPHAVEITPVRLDDTQSVTGNGPEAAPPPELPIAEHLSLGSLIESLLFVADGAVPIARLAEALEVPNREIEAALAALGENYRLRGLSLQRFRDKVQLTTSPSAAAQVERFLGLAAATPLSRAALEALAIVAYQQPVTRPQIEAVRGVNSDSVIKNLLTKGLIEESGRAEGPGRPVLYSTTSEFMQHFGLATLSDLPPLSPPSPDNAVNAERILKG
jgi:segregation and condensation protein B